MHYQLIKLKLFSRKKKSRKGKKKKKKKIFLLIYFFFSHKVKDLKKIHLAKRFPLQLSIHKLRRGKHLDRT